MKQTLQLTNQISSYTYTECPIHYVSEKAWWQSWDVPSDAGYKKAAALRTTLYYN